MSDEADLGPPRFTHSIDEWCEEVERQKRLVVTGDLRRAGGTTWAWCPVDKSWRWLSMWSTTSGGYWPSRDDREKAWKALEESL